MKTIKLLESYIGDIKFPPIGRLKELVIEVSIEEMIKIQDEIKNDVNAELVYTNNNDNTDIEFNVFRINKINIHFKIKK